MQRQHLISALVAFAVLGTACASSGSGESDSESPSPSRSRDVITRDELVASATHDAYEAIRRLRSSWLRGRGTGSTRSSTPVVAFMNNVRFGNVDALRSVAVEDIQEIRYINARDATTRWGTGFTNGAIEVITR
jgi:hypothetical protein